MRQTVFLCDRGGKDLLGGNLEDVTIEGVTDVLNRLDKKPKAVLLFTVCLHHFLGSDLDRIYGELEKDFRRSFYAVLHGSHHAENRPHTGSEASPGHV